MDKITILLIVFSLILGLGGWIIHLYTLILSYFSDNKWTIRVSFNEFHEAIPELIVFSGVVLFIIITIIMVIYI